MNSCSASPKPTTVFEGTDAVLHNRKVAVQRIVEIHNALEQKHQAEATTDGERNDSAHSSNDHLSLDFSAIHVPHGEVRAFRYFLRKWNHNESPDAEFDLAIQASPLDFDQVAIRHFFRRISLWNESDPVRKAANKDMESRLHKDKKRQRDSILGKLWLTERSSQEHSTNDELKEVTTREGLAQLLWTLMHDQRAPLAPQFVAECTEAVKRKYDLKPEGNVQETFIFMHGLGSSQDYYFALTDRLRGEGFRCIIFDNTGAGRSPYTFVEQSIQTLSDDVMGILDALEVSKAVFVGCSMGGIVGAHLAAENSDRIVAAVLVGPVYPNENVGPVFEKRIERVQKEGMQPIGDTVPHAAVGAQASPLVKAFIRELLLSQDPAGYCSHCRVIINAKPPNYAKISIPVLILAGDEDQSAPLEGCQKMFAEMGSREKKLEIMRGIGHWHCLEAFEEVGDLIHAFYDAIQ
ncbi:hypothetical protein ACEQ8H_001065 [Pleosporales sp. CAS-2024a]